MRAEDVRALFDLLDAEVHSAEGFRERLRSIIAPERAPIGDSYVPSLD